MAMIELSTKWLWQVIDKLDSTASPRVITYGWNDDGSLASITRPNGTVRSISYDSVGRPVALGITYYPSDEIQTLDVTPAPPIRKTKAIPEVAMTFDAANRVLTFNGQAVSHDADGNMTLGPLPATGAMESHAYDTRNRLTGAGGLTYTYNAEGNHVGIGGTETTSLVVDPQGALPKVLVRIKNGVTTRYVYGVGLQYEVSSAGDATYYHYDQSGNTAVLTDQAGVVVDRITYSSYGTIRYRQGSFDTPFLYGGFFGVMTDSNGLVAMRARYYNPLTKRFLTSDPAMDGLNWYAYANGNPINFADPLGLAPQDVQSQYTSFANYLGVAFNRNGMVLIMDHSAQVVESAQNHGVSPNLVAAVIMFEHRGWGLIPGSQYAEAALSYGKSVVSPASNPTYGFAQLGSDARASANLSVRQSLTAVGSIEGAAAWLGVQKQELVNAGVANPTAAQIATRYNWGNAPAGSVTDYGKNVGAIFNEVQWSFPKSNK